MYSNFISGLSVTAPDKLLKRALTDWRRLYEGVHITNRDSRKVARERATAKWRALRDKVNDAHRRVEVAEKNRSRLQRLGASESRLEEVQVEVESAKEDLESAQKRKRECGSLQEFLQKDRADNVASVTDAAFERIVGSLRYALSSQVIQNGDSPVRRSEIDVSIDIIDLRVFQDQTVRSDTFSDLLRGFASKHGADRLFVFGDFPVSEDQAAEPFLETEIQGVYLCNTKFEIGPVLLASFALYFAQPDEHNFFGSSKDLMEMRALGFHTSGIVCDDAYLAEGMHFDEITQSSEDLIDSRHGAGPTRFRDLEIRGVNSVIERSLAFEKLELPRRHGAYLFCAGRYYGKTKSPTAHSRDYLSPALLEWKKGYPEEVIACVCDFLVANQEAGSILTVVPDKPRKKQRMNELLLACRAKISSAKSFRWEPGLFKFTEQFEIHAAGGYRQRREKVRLYLTHGRIDLSGKRVLILDDIYTTGATLDEMAERLQRDMHAAQVDYFCMARTVAEQN